MLESYLFDLDLRMLCEPRDVCFFNNCLFTHAAAAVVQYIGYFSKALRRSAKVIAKMAVSGIIEQRPTIHPCIHGRLLARFGNCYQVQRRLSTDKLPRVGFFPQLHSQLLGRKLICVSIRRARQLAQNLLKKP